MCKGIHEITGKSGKYIQTLNNKMQTKFSDQFSFSFVISFFVHPDSWDGTEQIIIFVSYQNRQNSGLRNIKPNIGYKVYCNVYIYKTMIRLQFYSGTLHAKLKACNPWC